MTLTPSGRAETPPAEVEYWAGRIASTEQLEAWAKRFHQDGYLLIEHVLTPDMVERLRADIDSMLLHNPLFPSSPDRILSTSHKTRQDQPPEVTYSESEGRLDAVPDLRLRAYEVSPAHVGLFELEPIVSLAEMLLGKKCQVIVNNVVRTAENRTIDVWHQDDSPHFVVVDGDPPTNIQLQPLVIACNYYLTDISEEDGDGTEVIPGSHLLGASPPPSMEGTKWAGMVHSTHTKAGSVHIHNCQTWHRGGPNPGRPRYASQVAYARRLLGQSYSPFANYELPESVYEDASPRLRRLLGFAK